MSVSLKNKRECIYHGGYYLENMHNITVYHGCAIRTIHLQTSYDPSCSRVTVYFESGEVVEWPSKWFSSYHYQFGVAVSKDGKYVFAQTWDNGLRCLDSRTGALIWKSRSKRGITSLFVNTDTIVCHQHDRALQLLDIHTGEVKLEKRAPSAWGFTSIDHQNIVCHTTAHRWEIINPEDLTVKQSISNREFTDSHVDYCVRSIERVSHDRIRVCGFKNQFDQLGKNLQNLEFENFVQLK